MKRRILLIGLSILLIIAGVSASHPANWRQPWVVKGEFYNWYDHPNTPGYFTGDLEGAGYNYLLDSIVTHRSLVIVRGTSVLTLDDGEVFLNEILIGRQRDSVRCGIVRVYVTGGSSKWAGQGGHLRYRGCWDNSTFTGEWTYKGVLIPNRP